ncbi:DUF2207 domain-containing protein [Candidatus Microgenomates bacterium]|nr:DUF2207 domain-containing protein [Candidatus Microgenomates bacterium]
MKTKQGKKIFLAFLFCLIAVFLAPPVLAVEKITSFESEIVVQKNATVLITETIVYDFGSEDSHGIFREIPIIYKNEDGKKFKIDFQLISIKDEKRNSYQYKQSKQGENIKFKIGDPDKYVSGEKIYVISYKLSGVITYFSDHDELYWNVTGNSWQVPIDFAQAIIILPQEASENIKEICYTGRSGSQEQNCQSDFQSANKIIFTTNNFLSSFEGLTTVVSFPKDIVAYIEPKEAGLLLPIKILLFIISTGYYVVAPFSILYFWLKYGRDPKVGKPVTAWFDPPKDKDNRKLSVAEVGTLVDEHADEKDLSATIVDLAVRRYLKIKQKGKEFTLIKTKDFAGDSSLNSHEKTMLKFFFKDKDEISTTALKKNFYKTSQKVMDDLYKTLVEKGFFPENPKKVRDKFYLIGFLGLMTLNFALGVLAFLFGRVMPRKTLFGAQAKVKALGLKNFLSSQERTLEFQEKNWHFFEKLLPFAIVFNVANLWAKRFKGISVSPPDWYEGEYKGGFTPMIFTNSLLSSTSKFQSMAAPPSSSRSSSGFSSGFSGGSSGGGFGGGGGGSW